MTDKVWLVGAGAYSGWDVVCAAPDQETAEAIARAMAESAGGNYTYDSPEAVSVEMRSGPPLADRKWRQSTMVDMDGTETNRYPNTEAISDKEEQWEPVWPGETSGPPNVVVYGSAGPDGEDAAVHISVSGYGRDRVRKTFAEYLAMVKAEPALHYEKARAAQIAKMREASA